VSPAGRASTLQKEYRQQDLVQAAFRQIAERGFEGLRTRDVEAQAGVNIATLHYYFPGKEALIRAVIAHVMGRFRSTLAPHDSSDDQLIEHLRAVRTLLRREPQIGVVMGELALRSARDPSLGRLLRETNDAWHRMLRGLLRRAVKARRLPPARDSDDAAALIMSTLISMTLPSVPTNRTDQALKELEQWLADGRKMRPRSHSSK
jgi:AcrR family transcriptional regulator